MVNFQSAYNKLSDLNSNVSCHYIISRSGSIYNLLPTNIKAWHAGISKWQGFKNLNDYSVGIELENKGHEHGYQKFTNSQYRSLRKLTDSLIFYHRIKRSDILGHSDISPERKKDPGNKFSWKIIKNP